MAENTKIVQASQLDGTVVAAVIRDGRARIVTYHGRPECVLLKLDGDVKHVLAELRPLLAAGATLRKE